MFCNWQGWFVVLHSLCVSRKWPQDTSEKERDVQVNSNNSPDGQTARLEENKRQIQKGKNKQPVE